MFRVQLLTKTGSNARLPNLPAQALDRVGLVVASHGRGRGSPWRTVSSANSTRVDLLTNAWDLEGLSLALPDATGAGLCVLAGDVAENRELVNDVGFTFEPGSAADLAEMIRFFIANPVIHEVAGARRRSGFANNIFGPRWLRILRRFILPGGPAS